MRWLPLNLLVLSAACLPSAATALGQIGAGETAPALEHSAVRQWLDLEVPTRKDSAGIPSVVIAVVAAGQTVLVGYGADPVQDVFRVGSVSKPVAARVILTLAEQGLVDLHEDIADELDTLRVEPALRQPLTLHHLLTHTAGFNERLFGQHVRSKDALRSLDGYLREHLPPRFVEPGVLVAYNDHHTALASWLVQQRAGEQFAMLAQALVFKPAGMSDSTFEQVDLDPDYSRRRIRAVRSGTGPEYSPDFIQLPAAAGLYTTAGDMARFMRSVLQQPLGQLQVQFRHHPVLSGRGYGFAEGRHGGDIYFYKDGQASGFNARLLLYPARQIGIFVAHNRNIFGPLGRVEAAGRFNRALGSDLLQALWPAGVAENPGVPRTVDIALEPYAGTFRTVVAARHSWEKLISLFDEVSVTSSGKGLHLGSQRYLPAGDHVFFSADDAQRHIVFNTVAETVSHLFIGGGAYERVPRWTTQAMLPWSVGLPLVVMLVTGIMLLRRQWVLVVAGQFALLLFFVGLSALFWLIDIQQLFYGAPAVLLVLLALPLVAMAAFAVQAIGLIRHFSFVSALGVAAGIVLFAWLNYWNLLGYRLG